MLWDDVFIILALLVFVLGFVIFPKIMLFWFVFSVPVSLATGQYCHALELDNA